MSKDVEFKNRDRFIQLGIAIAALRKMRGMSQEQLSEKANVSRSHISAIEAPGIVRPFSLEVFFNIADALENLHDGVKFCPITFALIDKDEDVSPLYSDNDRDKTTILVVEEPLDIYAIEQTHNYKGNINNRVNYIAFCLVAQTVF